MAKVQGSRFRVQGFILAVYLILSFTSCSQKEGADRDEFSSPEKTYAVWIEAGVKGDLSRSTDCMTAASRRMMDQQAKHRDEFMRRMVASSAAFRSFSVVEKKESGGKAIILIESPDKKGRIAIPFLREDDGWKVDLVAMFGG